MRAQCYRSLRFLRNKSYGPQLGAVRMVKGERGRWNDGRRLDAGSREKNEKEGRKGERRECNLGGVRKTGGDKKDQSTLYD